LGENVNLTPAETKVFDLMAYGLTSKEIAGRIGCSFRTINIHRAKIMSKTGARNGGVLTRMSIMKKVREKIDAVEQAVMQGKNAEALTEIRNMNAFLRGTK
jgi:DNA-binding CsgD family transcriptional regulator